MQRLVQNIFDGYVMCFRTFLWHTSSNKSDITQVELSYFSKLGQSLGYMARREMNWNYPRDLCWVKSGAKEAFMYMERESKNERCEHTINKMLNKENSKNIEVLIASFGWLTESNFDWACSEFAHGLEESQTGLLFAWVGLTDDGPHVVKAATFHQKTITTKEAIPFIDKGGYWQINFEKGVEWKFQKQSTVV